MPVVVLGMDAGGLGVVRSLGNRGIPIYGLDDKPRNPGMRTRLARCIPVRTVRDESMLDDLAALARRLGRPALLIPTQRLPALVVSRNRSQLENAFRFVMPSPSLVEELEHKRHLRNHLVDTDVKAPRLVHLDRDQSPDALRELRYPCVVKAPDNSLNYQAHFRKVQFVDSFEQAIEMVGSIFVNHPDVVIEEYIPGDDSALYFCLQYRDRSGRLRASFVGRTVRTWPPGYGATSFCCAAPEAGRDVEGLANMLFEKVGMVGLCGADFKKDPASGQYFLLDAAVSRVERLAEVATLNGVNLPYTAYADLQDDHDYKPRQTQENHAWREGLTDRWSLSLADLSAPRDYACDRVHDVYWRWKDPGPATYAQWSRIRSKVLSLLPGGTKR